MGLVCVSQINAKFLATEAYWCHQMNLPEDFGLVESCLSYFRSVASERDLMLL